MLKKWIISAILSMAVLGATAAPALAGGRWDRYGHPYPGYYRPGYGYRGYGGSERDRVARRANRLYREGRLSRSHYNRTLDKLNQRGGRDWTRQVDRTLTEWSRADSRRRR